MAAWCRCMSRSSRANGDNETASSAAAAAVAVAAAASAASTSSVVQCEVSISVQPHSLLNAVRSSTSVATSLYSKASQTDDTSSLQPLKVQADDAAELAHSNRSCMRSSVLQKADAIASSGHLHCVSRHCPSWLVHCSNCLESRECPRNQTASHALNHDH